jgi:hypothetical protein
VVGHRVELDGVDLTDAVRERSLDLVASGGTDDEDPFGRSPERRPRDLAVVGVEPRRRVTRAVVAPDLRAP